MITPEQNNTSLNSLKNDVDDVAIALNDAINLIQLISDELDDLHTARDALTKATTIKDADNARNMLALAVSTRLDTLTTLNNLTSNIVVEKQNELTKLADC